MTAPKKKPAKASAPRPAGLTPSFVDGFTIGALFAAACMPTPEQQKVALDALSERFTSPAFRVVFGLPPMPVKAKARAMKAAGKGKGRAA
jgi:hypothetical protein